MAGFGILGGTFDPIHVGHLFLAEKSREALNLSKVIFVPASIPPHKIGEVTLPVDERLKMVEIAIQNHSQFEISRVEIDRVGPSYSIDTIRELKIQYPNEECFFIMGFDSLLGLDTWKDYQQILDETQLIAALRPGFPILQDDQDWPEFLKSYRRRIHLLKAPLIDISATWIRNELKEGRSIRYLVPDAVSEYIDQRHLYRNIHNSSLS